MSQKWAHLINAIYESVVLYSIRGEMNILTYNRTTAKNVSTSFNINDIKRLKY
jgi:hypothetical protein